MNKSKNALLYSLLIVSLLLPGCAAPAQPSATPAAGLPTQEMATPSASPTPWPEGVLTAESCSAIGEIIQMGGGVVNQMLYSPDNKYLLVTAAGAISLYDAQSLEILWNVPSRRNIIKAGFSSEKEFILALDSDAILHMIDISNGTLLNSASQSSGYMVTALTGNGEQVASASFAGKITIFETSAFTPIKEIDGPGTDQNAEMADSVYTELIFSPQRKYLALATQRTEIFIYQTFDGSLVRKIAALDPDYEKRVPIVRMAFSGEDETLAVEYQSGQTILYTSQGEGPGRIFPGTSPALSSNGQRMALKTANGIEIFNTASGNSVATLPDTLNAFGNTIFSPDDQRLAVVSHEKLEFWNLANNQVEKSIETTYSDYRTFAISSNSEFMAVGSRLDLEIFNTSTGGRLKLPSKHPVFLMKFLPNGQKIVAAGDKTISVWDLQTKTIQREIQVEDTLRSLDISLDGNNLMVFLTNGSIVVYDLASENKQTLGQAENKLLMAQFAPNGKNIYALDEQHRLLISKDDFSGFAPAGIEIEAFAFQLSPNKTVMTVILEKGDLAFFDAATGKPITTLRQDTPVISTVSPTGNLVITPDNVNGGLKFSEIIGGKECVLPGFRPIPRAMLVSEDGKYLIILDRSGVLHFLGTKAPGS